MLKFEKVKVSPKLKEISDYAFSKCDSLSQVEIPNGVEVIWDGAFCDCAEFKSINLPKTIKAISYSAFYDSGLKQINYAGTKKQWNKLNKVRNWAFDGIKVKCSDGTITMPVQAEISVSKKEVKKGKKTVVIVKATSGTKVTLTAENDLSKKGKYVKIKKWGKS